MKKKLPIYLLISLITLLYSINRYDNYFMVIGSIILITSILFLVIYKGSINKLLKRSLIISITLTSLVTIYLAPNFIGEYKYNTVTIKNISDDKILIDAIYVDGQKIPIDKAYDVKTDILNDASLNTEYQVQNKLGDDYKGSLAAKETYQFKVNKNKKIEIEIQKKNTSFDVSINNSVVNIAAFNYDEVNKRAAKMANYNDLYIIDNYNINYQNIWNWIKLLLLGISVFLLINLSFQNKKLQIVLLALILIEFNPFFLVDIISKIILIISLGLILKFGNFDFKPSKKNNFVMLGSSFLLSFSIFGKYIIDNFNIISFITYCLSILFFYYLILISISIIDLMIKNIKTTKSPKRLFLHRLIVFTITILILFFYQMLFYPYIYSADGFMEISDVYNNTLSNWHPYLHILLLKAVYFLFHNLNLFIYFRIIIYSLLFNIIIFYFHKKGLKLIYVYLITIIFHLCPTTGIMMVTLAKDVDFCICLVGLSYLLYLLFYDIKAFNKSKLNYLLLLIMLIGVAFFRHNGIYIAITVLVVLLFKMIKTKNKYLGVCLTMFLILSVILKGPLYQKLKVEAAPRNFNIATMIHGLGYIMAEDKTEFDQKTYKYLTNNVLTFKDFNLYYDKYNIDVMLHYNAKENSKIIRDKQINQKKIIKIYLKQLLKSPIYLLKDRLYGTDIIWDIVEDDKINTLKYQVLYDEFDVNYKTNNTINSCSSSFMTNILNWLASKSIFNILLFKVGLYLDLIIILLNYQIIKRKKTFIYLLPLLVNLLTLFIAMHYQAVRYVWMIFPIAFLNLLIVLFSNIRKSKIDNYL